MNSTVTGGKGTLALVDFYRKKIFACIDIAVEIFLDLQKAF